LGDVQVAGRVHCEAIGNAQEGGGGRATVAQSTALGSASRSADNALGVYLAYARNPEHGIRDVQVACGINRYGKR
jgi:hypothetical protein